jgi:predicted Ser/Thr protein kinase
MTGHGEQLLSALHDYPKRLTALPSFLPTLARRPDLVRRWLTRAYGAWAVLVISLLLGLLVVPSVADSVGNAIYPPKTKRAGFLGLRKVERRDPRADKASTAVIVLYWLGSAAITGAVLVLHVPFVMGREEERPGASPATHEAVAINPSTAPTALGSTGGTAADSTAATLATTGRYVPVSELGRGAMGIVYRARDTVLEREVALKELPPELKADEALCQRFRQEARVLARLTHPNIVQVYDLVESDDRMWMAMELVQGCSLAELLEQRGALPVDEVVELGVAMARAMEFAHGSGVIHRDFKPENVMVTASGVPKVMDFGIAKLMQRAPELTQEGSILGSPAYMSPEQAAGRPADARADVYAFGVTLYEMSTGSTPFTGDLTSVLTQHLTQPPPRPREVAPHVPAPLEDLVLHMLEKSPDDRPSDMTSVAERLHAVTTD